MLSLLVSLTACSACGGHKAAAPALDRADARPLAALAQRIAGEGACAQRRDIQALQRRTLSLVNAGRVPAQLEDTLVSGVNGLTADTPPCVPAVPATTVSAPTPAAPRPHDHGHEPHHDHGHGPGHHHGHGHEGD
jgi:hypothetical protein